MARKLREINKGDIFGQLTVLECVGYKDTVVSKINYYRCICTCGNIKDIRRNHLLASKTISCGCYQKTHMLNPLGETAHNILYGICKYSAKVRNIEFAISIEEHKKIIVDDCFYCGATPRGYRDIKANGIDRLDNQAGYRVGNLVACCYKCNHAKRNYSVDEFLSHAYSIVEYQNRLSRSK